jgi:hypothetical protein
MDMDNQMYNLISQRKALTDAAALWYDPCAFPGSKAYKAYAAKEQAVRDFDAAHPEVIAHIEAAKTARAAARVADSDVMGM